MNKEEWKERVGKTKWASHKKHLSKKELRNLYGALLKLNVLKEIQEVRKGLEKEPKSIKEILKGV